VEIVGIVLLWIGCCGFLLTLLRALPGWIKTGDDE